MGEELKIMSLEKMEKIVSEHKIRIDELCKKFKKTEEEIKQAIDIACDFNLENQADLEETMMIILHTIERINEV